MVHMRKKITFKDIQVGDIIEVTHTNPGGTVTTTVGQADKIYQEEVTDSYGDTIAWSWEDEPNIYLLVRKIGSVPEPEVGGVTFRNDDSTITFSFVRVSDGWRRVYSDGFGELMVWTDITKAFRDYDYTIV